MLESFNAARVRRSNARRSRLERDLIQAELGSLAADVDLDHVDPPAPSTRPDEQTQALRAALALQTVAPH